jgi:KaiC/GvpD/RAD55 family RecA-like ATPase
MMFSIFLSLIILTVYNNTSVKLCMYNFDSITAWWLNRQLHARQSIQKVEKRAEKKNEFFFLFIWRDSNFPPELLSGVPQFSLLFQQKKKKCFVGQFFTYTCVTQDSQKVARNNRMLSHYFFFLLTFLDVSLLSLDALHKKKKRRWQCGPWKIWQTCYKFLY